jgi:hypothetical protein
MIQHLASSREIFVIDDFLSPTECRQLIDKSESIGYAEAPITTHFGPLVLKQIRNNTRVMVEDPELTNELFTRAQSFLPQSLPGGWKLIGLNERLRYYRYDVGERFAPHRDGAFARNRKERSQLTFMIYLNDGFEGGETKFLEEPTFTVTPKLGSALVFVHRKLHEGALLIAGRKYVLRTDVMYQKTT